MNFKVQRFEPGHPFYSEANLTNSDASKGFIGTDKSVFGQFTDGGGESLHFTLERKSTLIPAGTYNYSFYFSPDNKCIVLLLHDVPGFSMIEHHIGNWWYNAKGCTMHGKAIDLKVPMLVGSRDAFEDLMDMITKAYQDATPTKNVDGKLVYGTVLGQITYENFNQNQTT